MTAKESQISKQSQKGEKTDAHQENARNTSIKKNACPAQTTLATPQL